MRFPWAILGAMGIALGPFLLAGSLSGIHEARAAAKWPSTTGTILSSRLKVERSAKWSSAFPEITYSYVVEGKTYTGKDVWGTAACLDEEARNAVGRFPVSVKADVYFDPDNPSRALLLPVVTTGMIRDCAIGALFLVGGAALVIRYLLHRRAVAKRPLLDRD